MKAGISSLRGVLFAVALASCAQAAVAAPVWRINPDGTGAGDSFAATQFDVGGVGFVQIVPDAANPAAFQFVEHGAYQILQPGTGSPFTGHDLTVSYMVSGSGSFLDPLALHFGAGNIALYSDAMHDFATSATHYGVDNGTLVARFNVFDGGVAATGLVTVKAILEAGSLLAGYLFAADGTDLATTIGTTIELGVFNQVTAPDSLLVAGVVCGLAGYAGPGCDGVSEFANSPLTFTVRDGGYATLGTAVPEPGTGILLCLGLGLLGTTLNVRGGATRPTRRNS